MRLRRALGIGLVALVGLGSVTAAGAATRSAPHATGSVSNAVRFGYFTTPDLFPVELRRISDFPAAVTEFDAQKDLGVVFVGAIDSPGRDFTVRGVLKREDGTEVYRFTETRKHHPDVKWHAVRHVFRRDRLRGEDRAKWTMDLFIDDRLAGTFRFDVAPHAEWVAKKETPATTVAKKESPPPTPGTVQPIRPIVRPESAPAPERSALVKLELSGPPSARVKIGRQERTLDSKGHLVVELKPDRYTIEVDQRGFKPYRHDLTLSADTPSTKHSIALQAFRAPTIALLDPKPGGDPVVEAQVTARIRVESEARPSALRIVQGGRVIERVPADPKLPAGQPWIVEPKLALAEGDNEFRIEVEDDQGGKGNQSITIARERSIDVELRAEAGSRLVVNKKEFTADRTGLLKLRLLPGDYDIEATKPGFQPLAERLTVRRGEASVRHRIAQSAVAAPTIAAEARGEQPVMGEQAKLRIEVKSDNRLATLRIVRDGRVIERLTSDTAQRAGQPWIVETELKGLAEGDNAVTIEAEDEFGSKGQRVVTIARERSIAVDLRGEPGAKVLVNKKDFSLDGQGRLALRLFPGDYQIEASKAGFLSLTERVTLTRGQASLNHELKFAKIPPPAIVLLEPKSDIPVHDALVLLKVEVRSPARLTTLKISRGGQEQMFRRDPKDAVGEAWIVEAPVRLTLGSNEVRLEAADDGGRSSTVTAKVTRQDMIARPPAPPEPPAQSPQPQQPQPPRPDAKVVALPPVAPPTPGAADMEPPRIVINYPPNDLKVEQEDIAVVGIVTHSTAVASVQITVNGMPLPATRDITAVGRSVPIQAPVVLRLGINVIAVYAMDRAGNARQEVRTVTRMLSGPPPPVIAKMGGERYAVIIGVGRYDHPSITPLKYAEKDARSMYEFLTTRGGFKKENVELLTDSTAGKPTLSNIRRALGERLVRRAGEKDTVVVYYAGHGAPEVDAAGIEADGLSKYLIPMDADPDSLFSTAFPMEDIQRIFARLRSERVVLLIDTCFSGSSGGRTFARMATRSGNLSDQFLERLTRSKGRVIMSASGPNELALELPEPIAHGIFTYYLLEGMGGKADRDNDGVVTVNELYEYVEKAVSEHARKVGGKQRPIMKGEVEGTLPLVEIKGR